MPHSVSLLRTVLLYIPDTQVYNHCEPIVKDNMKITVKQLRSLIKNVIQESRWDAPTGKLRTSKNPRSAGGRQVKAGKVEEDNRELSPTEVESMFPGAVDAWVETAPEIYDIFEPEKELWGSDPDVMRKKVAEKTFWAKIGDSLHVGFKEEPTITLAKWDPAAAGEGDWIEEAQPFENPNPMRDPWMR